MYHRVVLAYANCKHLGMSPTDILILGSETRENWI